MSDKKTLIFIDDKTCGEKIKELFIAFNNELAKDILILNADNIEKHEKEIEIMTLLHKSPRKIVITTSVLDNGVSIKDKEVQNLVVMTESEILFKQMVGRLRVESVEKCKLYFIGNEPSYYKKRLTRYENISKAIQEVKRIGLLGRERIKQDRILNGIFNLHEGMDVYEKFVIYLRDTKLNYYDYSYFFGAGFEEYGEEDGGLILNKFAIEKINHLLNAEKVFFVSVMQDPYNVAYIPMKWLGVDKKRLQILSSKYLDDIKKSIREFLLQVNGYSKEQLQKFKGEFIEKYQKDISKCFPEIEVRNRICATDKIKKISEELGLMFYKEQKNGKQIYSIIYKKEGDGFNE